MFLFCCFALLLIEGADCDVSRTKTNKQMLSELFEGYSPVIKPRRNLTESVDVNMTFHIISLREVDERLQVMTFIAWIELNWVDDFLILKDGIRSLLIPKEQIWYPDVAMFNSVEDPQHISDGQHIVLAEHGQAAWYPAREYSVMCAIDIRRYPFDEHTCQVLLGAWQSSVSIQRISDTGKSLADDEMDENGEWEIIDRLAEPNYSNAYRISFVTYAIRFRRRWLHPVINTLFPVILLSLLNSLVFLLPANSGEKMTLCISVLLSFTVFLTMFNDTMPKMSTNISYLSVYLCIQVAMSGVAIAGSIWIMRINDRENKASSNKQNTTNACHVNTNDNSDIGTSTLSLSDSVDTVGGVPIDISTEYDFRRSDSNRNAKHDSSVNSNGVHNGTSSTKWKLFKRSKYLRNDKGVRRTITSDRHDLILFWLLLSVTFLSTFALFIVLLV